MQILTILMPYPSAASHEEWLRSGRKILHHRHAAIHAEDLAGDVGRFV